MDYYKVQGVPKTLFEKFVIL